MALFFESSAVYGDFMPTFGEMETYRKKLKRYNESSSPTKRPRLETVFFIDYDDFGRNLASQAQRQAAIPWIKVKYDRRGRLFIPHDKKDLLRGMEILYQSYLFPRF